jgi:carbon monoxide dehydrogenase subunit G
MKLTGTATVRAPIADVYAALVDPVVLARAIPGCDRLEQIDTDSYTATVTAGVASLKGSFAGQVRLADRNPPGSLTLHASGAGAPGTVSAVARVALRDAGDGSTLVSYDADATIGGLIGGVGQRVFTGVARRQAADFFAAVDRELAGALVAAAPAAGALAQVVLPAEAVPSGAVPQVTAPASVPAPALPGSPPDLARHRMRDVLTGAVLGAAIALLGVLVGAIVVHW